jgi:hypothetical protein
MGKVQRGSFRYHCELSFLKSGAILFTDHITFLRLQTTINSKRNKKINPLTLGQDVNVLKMC